MAYTSDLRVKNLIKDIDVDVRKNLKAHDLDDKICLRIFDESKEDKEYGITAFPKGCVTKLEFLSYEVRNIID